FLFGVLDRLEPRIDLKLYDSYQMRVFGFIAERLFNCYLLYAKKKYSNIKITSTGLSFGTTPPPTHLISSSCLKLQKKSEETIQVCMSFDDNYAPHADATINSIIENTHQHQKICFHILCDEKLSP